MPLLLPWGAIDQGLSYNGTWRGDSQHMDPTCGRVRVGSRLWVPQNSELVSPT